jgi:hypothetical protein
MQPIRPVGALLNERLAVARQLSDGANRRWWNEAGTQQPVPQKISQPFGVLDVGLLSGNGPHVLRIDQYERPLVILQHIEDRPPVDPSRFHGHLGDLQIGESIRKLQQVRRDCSERAHVPLHRAIRLRDQRTGDDALFMHVQTTASRVNHVHGRSLQLSPGAAAAEREENTKFPCVLIPK